MRRRIFYLRIADKEILSATQLRFSGKSFRCDNAELHAEFFNAVSSFEDAISPCKIRRFKPLAHHTNSPRNDGSDVI